MPERMNNSSFAPKGFYSRDCGCGLRPQPVLKKGSLAKPIKRMLARPVRASAMDSNLASRKVLALASKIESMEDCDIRQRYHELVDKRMGGPLTAMERFELERIEIRLDEADRDLDLEARDREWELERSKLLDSINDLVMTLRK